MKGEGFTPQHIIEKINALFKNAIVITDAGQNHLWTTQFLELDENRQMLISGDGGMQMNIQELTMAMSMSFR